MPTTSKRLIPKTFKLLPTHIEKLNTGIYKEAPGILIRVLLDLYFEGRIPAAEFRYKLKLSVLRENQNGSAKRTA